MFSATFWNIKTLSSFCSLLQLTGMFVTYFVLLIQFQPAEDCDVIMDSIIQNLTQVFRETAYNITSTRDLTP